MASLNVNSLLLHIDEIRNLTKDLDTHILAINETKLDKNVHDDLIGISGFPLRDVIAAATVAVLLFISRTPLWTSVLFVMTFQILH